MMLKEFALFIAFALVPAVYGTATRGTGGTIYTDCSTNADACLATYHTKCDTGNTDKCVCITGYYDDGTAADCQAKKAVGESCTVSPAGQCAAGGTCTDLFCKAALGAKCTAENGANNCVGTEVCRKQDTATNLKCTAPNTLYAACTAATTDTTDPCTKVSDKTECKSTICKCKEGYEAKVGTTGVSTCEKSESGAGFIQGSVLTVVLTAMAAVWARG